MVCDFLARSLPIIERRNWLIHLHYVRKDYLTCKVSNITMMMILMLVVSLPKQDIFVPQFMRQPFMGG